MVFGRFGPLSAICLFGLLMITSFSAGSSAGAAAATNESVSVADVDRVLVETESDIRESLKEQLANSSSIARHDRISDRLSGNFEMVLELMVGLMRAGLSFGYGHPAIGSLLGKAMPVIIGLWVLPFLLFAINRIRYFAIVKQKLNPIHWIF